MPPGGGKPSRHLQARERSVAGPEMIGFDAQTLEHAHVEIAQGRRVLRIEMQVLAVLEAAAGEEDGEIFRRVAAGVAGIAAGENGGAVEEVGVAFAGLAEFGEKIMHCLHGFNLDNLELRKLAGIFAVVRQIVMACADAFDGGARRWCRRA